jgi:hypothetical protein
MSRTKNQNRATTPLDRLLRAIIRRTKDPKIRRWCEELLRHGERANGEKID